MAKESLSLQATTEKAAAEAHKLVNPQHLEFAPSSLPAVNASSSPLLNAANTNAANVVNQVPLPPTATPPMPTGGGTSNPLDQLKDIHLPEPVTFFPSAPGWWLLGSIILVLIAYFIYRQYRYKKLIRLMTPAAQEINYLKQISPSASSLAQLSALLKRISLVYFPQLQVASLKGTQWLNFINHQSQDSSKQRVIFSEPYASLLTQAAYQKKPQIDPLDWKNLLRLSQQWIENIITQQAKKQLKEGVKL